MSAAELHCPICDADFPLSGDERSGEELFCTYCGTPCRLTHDPDSAYCQVEEEI